MHKIIFLNGPPGSGKDTAGMIIKRTFNARTYKMSRPLKDGLRGFFNIDFDEMRTHVEPNKDSQFVMFGGLSWREVQISLSETWAKPLLGQDIFGNLAVGYLSHMTGTDMTAITDSGFRAEALPVVLCFGPDNCLLIKLAREGCTFADNDARDYIYLDDLGVVTSTIDNQFPLTATDDAPITFAMQLGKVIRDWLGEEQE